MTAPGPICRWCCGAEVRRLSFGAKARWIVANPKSDLLTELVQCEDCSLVYFTVDFSDSELKQMYDEYRGSAYFVRRHRYEPWYTSRVNDAIGHSNSVLEHRRTHLKNVIVGAAERGSISSPTRVLDVGGDEGQFIPEIATISERAVLEVSGVRPVDGVDTVHTWQEAGDFQPDLIMMCHVLEHTSSAREMVAASADVLSSGGLLYLEVPLDRPLRVPTLMGRSWYRTYTRWLSRHPQIFLVADALSLVSRRFLGRPAIGSVIKQNEHINFFDEHSLSCVVETLGFRRIAESVYKPSSGVPILDVSALGVLYERL